MRTHLAVALAQLSTIALRRRLRHHRVEVPLQPLAILAAGARRQLLPPRRQHARAQQRLHPWCEDRIACLDGELAVSQLMRQADLPVLGMALLRAVEIRDPDRRTVAVHHLGHDAGAAAVADDVDHHLIVLKHPVPEGLAGDAHGCLVRAHHAGAPQPRQDGTDLGVEAGHGAAEGGVKRAFADRQAASVG